MSITPLLKLARALSVLTGVGFSLVSQGKMLGALLTGPGSIVHTALLEGGHAAASPAIQAASGAAQFVIGIGFIMVGFFLHALIGVREEYEREVHITVKPKKRERKWFWIEVKI